ncbi:response regulator transcription factor [Streptomyces sp. NPDC001404]|uniref:response regulator transcription factor n=1 Tax=Streptomyces sp. NPDC001404 TaxID=3364571 RepID=UPI00369BE1AD
MGVLPALLSEGELQVLALVGEGMTNAQIVRALQPSAPSVKTYVSRTLAKLGLGAAPRRRSSPARRGSLAREPGACPMGRHRPRGGGLGVRVRRGRPAGRPGPGSRRPVSSAGGSPDSERGPSPGARPTA